MPRQELHVFDETPESLDRRIATGLHKIGLAIRHRTWHAATKDGLSPTQGQILAALAMDGPLTGTKLAERLGLTLPTISDSARALVAKGFARKRLDASHPRAALLELTRAGRTRATSASAWPEFLAWAVGTLTQSEKAAFLAGLTKVIRTLQADGHIPASRMCVSCVYFRPRVHDGELPHHCAFVDAPMADQHLRLDCEDQEEAPEEQRREAWASFLRAR